VSGQLGDDRSEGISGVGADDKVGEAAPEGAIIGLSYAPSMHS